MRKIMHLSWFILILMSYTSSDFYSSMTKVDYVESSRKLKFTTKMNISHISNVIKSKPGTASFDIEIKEYVSSKVSLFVNGNNKNLIFTGNQISGESVWVYYESNEIENISSIKIKNDILLENYPRQVNLVNIAYKGIQKNMTLRRNAETSEVSF